MQAASFKYIFAHFEVTLATTDVTIGDTISSHVV